MRAAIALVAACLALCPARALAACDFSSGVARQPDGQYLYSAECHVEAGRAVRGEALQRRRAEELEKAVELKDLALSRQALRSNDWMLAAEKCQDRAARAESMSSGNTALAFAGGVLTAVLAAWAVGQAAR